MKAVEIARAFAGNFAADGVVPGAMCLLEQETATIVLPILVFDVRTQAMNDKGSALLYTLTVWIKTSGDRALPDDEDPAETHAGYVEDVRAKLHGSGKTALLASLNAGFAYGFDFRNWSAIDSDPGIEGNHFETPVIAQGVALVV